MPLGGAITIGATALGAGEGGFQLINSIKKEKEDNAELSTLKQPFYKIQDEFYQNRNLGANLASQGLDPASKSYLTKESQRGLTAGIEASGGNANDIAKLYDTYSDSILKNASLDASTHLKNIDYFLEANKDLAGQKITKQSLDEFQPYERKLKELTERKSADETSAYNGANELIGSVSAAGTAITNDNLMKKLSGDKKTKQDPFDGNSDFQKWLLNGEGLGTKEVDVLKNQQVENKDNSTSYILNLMKNDPSAFASLLSPNSPLFNFANQPQ